MKNLIRLGLILAATAAGSLAAPFMAIGDGAELFLTGGLGVRADDNIYLTRDAESDLVFEFAPGIDLNFGKGARLQGVLSLVHTFSNYADSSTLNTNLFTGDFVSRFDDGKLKLNFQTSFRELNQNSVDVRAALAGMSRHFIRRDVFMVKGTAEVEISPITSIAAGFEFVQENFKRPGFTDSTSLTVPLDVFYKWTPKTDVSVGYRQRDYRVDLGRDSTDHFFSVGARGEFSPKIKGKFAVGLNTRRIDGGGTENQLGLNASFAYELTPKTSVQLEGSNDFGTGARGEQQKNTILNARVTTKISEVWNVNAGLLWRAIDFGPSTDEYYEAQLGASYVFSANLRLLGTFIHRGYGSDLSVNEFKNNVFNLAASFRY